MVTLVTKALLTNTNETVYSANDGLLLPIIGFSPKLIRYPGYCHLNQFSVIVEQNVLLVSSSERCRAGDVTTLR